MAKSRIKIKSMSPAKIADAIRAEIDRAADLAFKVCVKNIQDRLRIVVKHAIMDAPEYQSMVLGGLRGEFGFTDAQIVRIEQILNVWVNTIFVYVVKNKNVFGGSNKKIKAKLKIDIIYTDYHDVLGLPAASTTIETKAGEIFEMKWLQWLLLAGDRTLVTDWHVVFKPGTGRSYMAFMAKKGMWRVPPKHSGTIDKNWVTKAMKVAEEEIKKIIEQEVRAAF